LTIGQSLEKQERKDRQFERPDIFALSRRQQKRKEEGSSVGGCGQQESDALTTCNRVLEHIGKSM